MARAFGLFATSSSCDSKAYHISTRLFFAFLTKTSCSFVTLEKKNDRLSILHIKLLNSPLFEAFMNRGQADHCLKMGPEENNCTK